MLTNEQQQAIIEKILKLPPEEIVAVEDFIDFLIWRQAKLDQEESETV